VGLAALAYAGASLLSLSSVPFDAVPDLYQVSGDARGLLRLAGDLARADVLDLIYAPLTVILALQALVAALVTAIVVERDPAAIRWIGGALLAGLALAVGLGLLDFHHLIDLRDLRAFDPVTNRSGVLRLQSTFGHSGWFAEFVCFTLAAVLWLSVWPANRRAAAAIAVPLFVATTVAIVLSSQRGGWITYVLLLGVLAALARRQGSAVGLRRLAVPLAAVLAVTAIVTVAAVRNSAAGVGPATGLLDRFRYVTQVSDRSAHVLAGLRLGAALPILGGGSESFAIRYREEYLLAGGRYYQRGYSPLADLYGSAHNVFAQTFAGKGAAGLGALVWLVVAAGLTAWRATRTDPPARRLAAGIATGGLAGFAIYGQVQEVFYIQALQLVVFTHVGLAAALARGGGPALLRRSGLVAAGLAAVLVAHLVHAYVIPGQLADSFRSRQLDRAGLRLLPPQLDPDDGFFQWSGASAFLTVPRQATRFAAEIRSRAPFPQTVELRFDGRVIDRIVLREPMWRSIRYGGRVWELPQRIELKVSPTWQPPGEARPLGVMVRRIDWGLPPRPDDPVAERH
jgi:O-antigen ligase